MGCPIDGKKTYAPARPSSGRNSARDAGRKPHRSWVGEESYDEEFDLLDPIDELWLRQNVVY